MSAIVEPIPFDDPHLNGKAIVLRGRWSEVPLSKVKGHPTTITRTVYLNKVASGQVKIEDEYEFVRKTVEEYIANHLAGQKALEVLKDLVNV